MYGDPRDLPVLTPPVPTRRSSGLADAAHAEAAADADAHVAADGHDASHADAVAHASGVDFPIPDNHQPWTPDAPLMEGMSRVRTAIAALEGQPDRKSTRLNSSH